MEELKKCEVNGENCKFHRWVTKLTEDEPHQEISYGLIELPNGKLEEVSHLYIKFT